MESTTQATSVIYGGFRKRVLAALVDLGFGFFVIPTIVSIYYYFTEGQTLGYKVMGLKILRSDEISKPGFWRLLARWIVKGAGGVVIIGMIWFIVNLIFWVLGTMASAQGSIHEVTSSSQNLATLKPDDLIRFNPELQRQMLSGDPSADSFGSFGLLRSLKSLINRLLGLLSLFSLFGVGIMPLSIIWNDKKRGRHDQIVDTTVLQIDQVHTVWAVVGIVLLFGGFVVNVLVRLAAMK